MVFLSGPSVPQRAGHLKFDLTENRRIGELLIEDALSTHFAKHGLAIQRGHFERLAVRIRPDAPNDAIELSTGVAFSAKRPFKEEPLRFAVSFTWEVRAVFREDLSSPRITQIASGMPVLYTPQGPVAPDLAQFRNRYLGRVQAIEPRNQIVVISRTDGRPHRLDGRDLKLEASPQVIKKFERTSGTSPTIREIQRLNRSFTPDNRRNTMAARDRLGEIRALLASVGSSSDRLIVPLASFETGSVSVSTAPTEVSIGDWR